MGSGSNLKKAQVNVNSLGDDHDVLETKLINWNITVFLGPLAPTEVIF